ncbi:MAG TPA: hypothetical protein VKC90_10845 [Chitinophagaceae bacterium]|nr:hypothetical protein [Chitinophagaceae bacterium]
MRHSKKCLIAIYDELNVCKQLLHHSLEREFHFEILFSSDKKNKLLESISNQQPHILLVNAHSSLTNANVCITKMRDHNKTLSIVFYCCDPDSLLSKKLAAKYKHDVFFCGDDYTSLIDILEKLTMPFGRPVLDRNTSVHLVPGDPFFKVAANEKYQRILHYLSEGYVPKQISTFMGIPLNTIKSAIKNLREITGSPTTIKLVLDADKKQLI